MGRGLLIIVSGMIIVYGIIQNSVNDRKQSMTRSNVDHAAKTQAQNIANAMADLSYRNVRNAGPNSGCDNGDLAEREMFNGKGSAQVNCSQNNGFRIKTITATGISENDKRKVTTTVTLKTKRNPFSRFSYFTGSETFSNGNVIRFGTSDVLNGPVHTNGTFTIDGDPTFNGPVTSAGGVNYVNNSDGNPDPPDGPDGDNSDEPAYNDQTNFNAEEVDLPVGGEGDDQIEKIVDQANNGGLQFDGPIKVEFQDNGSGNEGQVSISTGTQSGYKCIKWDYSSYYGWQCEKKEATYSWNSPQTYNLQNYNGVISSGDNVEVKGELNGNVTLHSAKEIEITGDIRYKDKPDENGHGGDSESDDYLGLVSEGQTKVDEDAHKDNGSKDIDIHASIMALADESSFTVENYDDGENRGQLNILGGLIQKRRGPVALGGSGGISSGYAKNYTYDSRFLRNSPQGFPQTGNYGRFSWNSTTQVTNK